MRKRPSRRPNETHKYDDSYEDEYGCANEFFTDVTVGFAMVKNFQFTKKRVVSTLMRGISEAWGIPDAFLPEIICRHGRRYIKPHYSSKTHDWDDNPYIFRTPSYYTIRRRNRDKGNRTN